MKVKHAVIGTLGLAAAVAAGLILHTPTKPTPFPKDKILGMQFPVGLEKVVGASDGTVCHSLKANSGPLGSRHKFPALDWRHASEQQKEQWVIEETLSDADKQVLACYRPDGTEFLHRAYAGNKICQDPEGCGSGGDCISWSCPASIKQNGGCENNGVDCVITYFCCGGGCSASC